MVPNDPPNGPLGGGPLGSGPIDGGPPDGGPLDGGALDGGPPGDGNPDGEPTAGGIPCGPQGEPHGDPQNKFSNGLLNVGAFIQLGFPHGVLVFPR